jgi:metal-dependent amidase/aminoacylase/carboxypeptidase family protein
MIEGGNRTNIIPDEVRMAGTIRILNEAMRKDILDRVRRTAENIADAARAKAIVEFSDGNPVTYNDPALTERMAPSLRRVAPDRFDANTDALTTAEDFAYYQKKVPGIYFFLGIAPEGADLSKVEMNHSPRFSPDEGAMVVGVRALASLAVDYLFKAGT